LAKKWRIGDIVKLDYTGFSKCPKGTIVKITEIEELSDGYYNVVFVHKRISYRVADFEVTEANFIFR
jgi:Lon protease-like protein